MYEARGRRPDRRPESAAHPSPLVQRRYGNALFCPTPYNSGDEPGNDGVSGVQKRAARKPVLAGAVWALGLTSLFMDFSSEMIHGLLPVFLILNLGASAAMLGLVEGIAEATAYISRVFSGWL